MKQFITIIILITFISFPVFSDGLALTTNSPIGEGKGIFPGRVVWMRDTTVAKWDGKTGRWWDDGSINLSAFEKMYDKSVMALTGTDNVRTAWKKIFKHYNRSLGRGNHGYRQGEKIAIKINLNNTYQVNDEDNDIDQSPQATISILRQLTENAGVPEECIVIYDATIGWKPRAMPDRLYHPIHQLFPNVRWMSLTILRNHYSREI